MKRKDAKEHSTAYKVGGLGLKTLRRVSKNFPTELSVKYTRRGQTTPQIFHQGVTKKALISITLKVLNISPQKLASEQRTFGKSF